MTVQLLEDPFAFARLARDTEPFAPPTMRAAFVVEPSALGIAEQSRTDNVWMQASHEIDRERARAQHHALVDALNSVGLATLVIPGSPGLHDAVFPNNVYGFGPGGWIVGSMRHEVRRKEADRTDVRELFSHLFGARGWDLSTGPVCELTGVLAIDRSRALAVCGLSTRVDRASLKRVAEAFGLSAILCTPLAPWAYHLNVVFTILAGRAVLMGDHAFTDPRIPEAMDRAWPGAVAHLSPQEVEAWAANSLALTQAHLLMPASAEAVLSESTRQFLDAHGFSRVVVDVSEFERAGGSARCMVGEIF